MYVLCVRGGLHGGLLSLFVGTSSIWFVLSIGLRLSSSFASVISSVGTLEARLIVTLLLLAVMLFTAACVLVTGGGGAFRFGTMLFLSLFCSARGASMRLFVAS